MALFLFFLRDKHNRQPLYVIFLLLPTFMEVKPLSRSFVRSYLVSHPCNSYVSGFEIRIKYALPSWHQHRPDPKFRYQRLDPFFWKASQPLGKLIRSTESYSVHTVGRTYNYPDDEWPMEKDFQWGMAPNLIEGPKLDRIYKTFVPFRNILFAFPSSVFS